MATLQLDLDRRRKKLDDNYPLVFKITCNRKQVMINTGISIKELDFDSENGIIRDSPLLNEKLLKLDRTYLNRFMHYVIQNHGNEDMNELKLYILNKSPEEVTIAEFWDKTIQELMGMGRLGGAKIYIQSKSTLEKHTNFNVPFLKFCYRDLLQLEQKLHLSGMSVNGMGVYLRCYRTICNNAIKQDLVSFEWHLMESCTSFCNSSFVFISEFIKCNCIVTGQNSANKCRIYLHAQCKDLYLIERERNSNY